MIYCPRWQQVGTDADNASTVMGVQTVAVHACADADCYLPSKSFIKQKQLEAIVGGGAVEIATPSGPAEQDSEGLYLVVCAGQPVLWVLAGVEALHARLMVCAPMKGQRHRGTVATLEVLRRYCVCMSMEADVVASVKQCFHCVDAKAGGG